MQINPQNWTNTATLTLHPGSTFSVNGGERFAIEEHDELIEVWRVPKEEYPVFYGYRVDDIYCFYSMGCQRENGNMYVAAAQVVANII